jgi:DNA-binding CsgD family transcriptional regulator
MTGAELLGRAAERTTLEHVLERASNQPAGLLLDGEAGIGKTMLWREGIALARERGFSVLACEPTATETPLAFAGLGDLLDELPLEILRRLPPPQRNALEISLLLVEPSEGAIDQHAVALAVLALIRTVVRTTPLLIAIDDVTWLDSSSTRVLGFALRRVRSGPVGLLVTRRSGEVATEELPFGLDRSDDLAQAIERRTLGPLSLGAIGRLLNQRTGKRVPRQLLTQLYRATNGNPFYSLELARSEIERGPAAAGQPFRVPEHLSAVVSDRLAALKPTTQETLLIAAALSEPTEELVRAAGGDSLTEAIEAGVVEIENDRIRFCHPLHVSVLYSRATPDRRRKLHKRLAEIVANPEERARHLALGCDGPDPVVAADLEAAAHRAASRGAPDAAAELLEHSARLTPLDYLDDIHRRRVEAIYRYYEAGDLERARSLGEEMMSKLDKSPWRTDVLVLLADLVEDQRTAVDLCKKAIEAAGDDECRLAMSYLALARALSILGDFPGQVDAQHNALTHAERTDRPRLLVEALQGVGNVTVLGGGAIDEEIMQRAIAIDRQGVDLTAFHRPSFWYGMQLRWIDEIERARPLLTAELERALHEGDLIGYLQILCAVIEIEIRSGHWDSAEQLVNDGLEQALDIGHRYVVRSVAFQQLQLSVLRGQVEESQRGLAELTAQTERAGSRAQALTLMSLSGLLALSLGNAREAWRWLKPALELQDELGRDISVGMPLSIIRPNAIETLVALDEIDKAEALLSHFEDHVERTRRPNGLVSSARSRALVAAARGDLETAGAALERALAAHEFLPDPFERGRTMLVLGTMERRAKRKRKAREALEQAHEIFSGLGARLWAAKVETELERVGGRRDSGSGLTPTELQVAELVASGYSNKEVAAQLFVSVRTVEANLSKIFRKLGVDSRTELATRIPPRSGPVSPR